MHFIFIFGPQAVGKMTVGQILAEKLHYRLLYNHLTIDLADAMYPRSDANFEKYLYQLDYNNFVHLIENADLRGLIFTGEWCFDMCYDNSFKKEMFELFYKSGWRIDLLELSASLEIRIRRNTSENRLKYKPSKRNQGYSENQIRTADQHHILNSFNYDKFELSPQVTQHITINSEYSSPNDVVNQFLAQLDWKTVDPDSRS